MRQALYQKYNVRTGTFGFRLGQRLGTFCLVENGLTSAGAPEFLDTCDNAYVTRGKIVDGWVATAELLVAARS